MYVACRYLCTNVGVKVKSKILNKVFLLCSIAPLLTTCKVFLTAGCVFLSGTAYIHHNMDKLSRIYPGGFRTDSSNYNPVPMWNVGCQIGTVSPLTLYGLLPRPHVVMPDGVLCCLSVALNFQTPSKEMHLNQGRFLPNAFSGYILKPEFLRSLSSQFDPNTLSKGPWLKRKTFHVMVSSKFFQQVVDCGQAVGLKRQKLAGQTSRCVTEK